LRQVKKVGIFLGLLVLLAGFALLLFQPLVADCVSVLRSGRGQLQYVAAASSETGEIYALGRDGDTFTIAQGSQNGDRAGIWKLASGALPAGARVACFYPDTRNVFYIGVYEMDAAGNAADLALYRLSNRGKTSALLLKKACTGSSVPEQMNSVRLSAFSKVSGETCFSLLTPGGVTSYRVAEGDAGVQEGETVVASNVRAALTLTDGRLAMASGASLTLSGEGESFSRDNQIVTDLRQAGAGIYSIDRAGLAVFYTDLTSPDRYQLVISLDKNEYDLNGTTGLSLTGDGNVLLLLRGDTLLLDSGSAVKDLTGILYWPAWQCGMILAGLGLAVAALAFALWYAVFQWRAAQIPLLFRWGVLLVAVGVLAVSALLRWGILPHRGLSAAQQANALTGSITALTLQSQQPGDADLPAQLARGLADAGADYRDTAVSVYEKGRDNIWRLSSTNTGALPGTQAELTPDFDRNLALTAQQQTVAGTLTGDGQPRYCRYQMQDGLLLTVSVGGGALLRDAQPFYSRITQDVWAVAALIMALAVAVLAGLSIGLRRVAAGVERLAAGKTNVRIRLRTGDELEGLATAVNSLGDTMEALDEKQRELSRAYLRFVPERVLALLGKKSLSEVDKQTFAARKMSAMMIWFGFPQATYEKSGKELFDNLNEIIERTASVVSTKGGTVFNFAYDGYDAVFEGEPALAVSTAVAVQQEILSINRERELDGRPQVTLRIALDEGNMVIGVVGDESQLEPTAISSSFSVARRLIALCNVLDANILCTEAVASSAGAYGSRYMGKCLDGGEAVRTYEIFDGDPYDIRRVKALTGKRFSEGVYALYSRNFQKAKRIFLDLVHHNTGDGGARYYLYLADELEKHPDREINLSGR
jgi:HAMP domain-containing protein